MLKLDNNNKSDWFDVEFFLNPKARKSNEKTRHEILTVVELSREETLFYKEIQKRHFTDKYAQLVKK